MSQEPQRPTTDTPPGSPWPARLTAAVFAVTAAGLVVGRAAGWLPFSWLETAGALTGAACVGLVVARSVWNFPLGIVSCALYLVFFAQGRLYAEAGLQVLFIVLGVHGWVAWSRVREAETPVRRVGLGELTALIAVFPAVWLGLTQVLVLVDGAAPVLDAFVTALSLAAQWLLNRRHVESWHAWIVVDQVSIVLYWSRAMYLTSGLYALFLLMCVAGLFEWRRELDRSRP